MKVFLLLSFELILSVSLLRRPFIQKPSCRRDRERESGENTTLKLVRATNKTGSDLFGKQVLLF